MSGKVSINLGNQWIDINGDDDDSADYRLRAYGDLTMNLTHIEREFWQRVDDAAKALNDLCDDYFERTGDGATAGDVRQHVFALTNKVPPEIKIERLQALLR